MVSNRVRTLVPAWAREITTATLRADVVAGLTLAAYMLPAAVADASLAGLPPQAGLYACIFAGAVFWVFTGARKTAVTVTTGLSLLIGASVGELSNGDPARHAALVAAATLWAGAFGMMAWAMRAGVIARFVSETVLVGFKAGVAMHLIATQLPKLLGFRGAGDDFFDRMLHVVRHLADAQPWALALGLAALALLLAGKALLPGRPVALVVVGLAIAAGAAVDLPAHGVAVVGAVPQGLPLPGLPDVSRADLRATLPIGLACFLLAIVETSAIGRMFARRDGHRYDADRDFLAVAAANLAAALGRGFAVGGGTSQSVVNDGAGARTPLSGLAATVVLLLVALFLSGLLETLPQPVLAAVVLAAVTGLLDLPGFVRLWRYRASEGLIATAALFGVLAAGLLEGVLLGALISLLLLLRAALSPRVPELGRLAEEGGYVDLERHPQAVRPAGALVVRCDSSILYMNAEHVLDEVTARLAARPDPVTRVVFSLETVPQIDLAGAEMLIELHRALAARGIALDLADMRDRVREALRDAGFERHCAPAVAHREIGEFLRG